MEPTSDDAIKFGEDFHILNGTEQDYRAALEIAQAQHEQGLLEDARFDDIREACLRGIAEACKNRVPRHAAVDMVNEPPHYMAMDGSGLECIDFMKAMATKEEFRGYLKCQVAKYLWREGRKDEGKALEDLEKGEFYYKRLIELESE